MLFLMILPSLCLADAASQTDWSGGPVYGGVTTSWGNVFATAEGVDWSTSPGQLLLVTGSDRSTPDCISISGGSDYLAEGYAYSSILNTQCNPDWGVILWSATTPSGTQVQFNVRASDTYWAMGDWSDTIVSSSPLSDYIEDGAQYFQYRAYLSANTPATTPALGEITISWQPILGADGGPVPASLELLPVTPNPASSFASACFALPDPAQVELLVFDVSGRLERAIASAEYQPGWHTVQLGDLRPGVHFLRMTSGQFSAIQRFVVVE